MKTQVPSIMNDGAKWIWPQAVPSTVNLIVQFRQVFEVDDIDVPAELLISADGAYVAYLNGVMLGTGPYTDWPDNKTFDRWCVAKHLQLGSNTLAMRVAWWGVDHFSYLPGPPGVIASLRVNSSPYCVTGKGTWWREETCYRTGPTVDRINSQLPFTFDYDAAGDDGWLSSDAPQGGSWQAINPDDITATVQRPVLDERPVSNLVITQPLPTKIIAQGVLRRTECPDRPIAHLMQTDFLSSREAAELFGRSQAPIIMDCDGVRIAPPDPSDADGAYLVIDLGAESVGLLHLEMDAPAGCKVDIAWGENLDDLRVRALVGGRNFAGRYRCRQGAQCFTHALMRIAARYLQLHITNLTAPLTLRYAGLLPTNYPLTPVGEFNCDDTLLRDIYSIAARTLQLCIHEHYEDCPWREQGLYAADARNQMLAGYYAFGETRMPSASLMLLGQGLHQDGYIPLTAPGTFEKRIPGFTFAWVLAAWEHELYAGPLGWDGGRHRDEAMEIVQRTLEPRLNEMESGLLPTPKGSTYWHFYDWADGLDGMDCNNTPPFGILSERRVDAVLNALFGMALDAGARLTESSMPEFASRCRSAVVKMAGSFHEKFWDARCGCYRTYAENAEPAHFCQLVQALALCAGFVPEDLAKALREKLSAEDSGLVPASLSQSIYVHQAMLAGKDEFRHWVFDDIRRRWGMMLRTGATAFWETQEGPWAFGRAGSCCHGWSATPAYVLGAYLLGVRPLKPGFAEFVVDPVAIMPRAWGVVPTPHGHIRISWRMTDGGMQLDVEGPEACRRVFPSR